MCRAVCGDGLFPPSALLRKMDPSQRWKTPLPLSLTLAHNWVSLGFFFCLHALGYTFTHTLSASYTHIFKGDSHPAHHFPDEGEV